MEEKSRKQPTNRKRVTKDRKRRENGVPNDDVVVGDYRLENLDDQPQRTLEELQRDSLWFKCTDEEIDNIKMGFIEKLSKPYRFEKDGEEAEERLDPTSIIKQYSEMLIPEADTEPLYHNFSIGTEDHMRLFHWSKHDSITSFFCPINYQIYGARESKNVPPKALNSIFQLQNALIYSHFQQTSFRTVDLVKQLEILLNSIVTHVYMTREAVVFLFEWQEEDTFSLTVCFSIIYPDAGRIVGRDEVVCMERSDLLDDSVAPINNSVMEEEGEGEKTKKQDLATEKKREVLRECRLSYIYYGYIKRT